MKKPEILSPCGTFEALEAAVKAGADAVYLGGSLFSARAFAGNFDKEELLRAIDYCHFYSVKIYMALNTLLKDDEIIKVRDYIRPYYEAGLDGVIVQDTSVAGVLAREYPDLPLHASTQMSVSSVHGAEFLKKIGFTRIVPARELSLEEIKQIKSRVDIEIETFVHGAMCFAYSGKCLLSSFIGGRSGNRGRCAQPCRQCWKLRSASQPGKAIADEYVMSLKDMCLIDNVPDLMAAGIDSFKIEGRMKKPEYVALVTRSYRQACDMEAEGCWDTDKINRMTLEMKDIYNRGGFSTGYYFDENGRKMLADKRPNHSGVKVGEVVKVAAPDVAVKLDLDVNAGDVLEIRAEDRTIKERTNPGTKTASAGNVELTSPSDSGGSILTLKGKEFNKIRKGMSVYRIRNNSLIDSVRREVIDPEKSVQAEALVEARVGEPLTITVWKDDICVSVQGGIVQEASNRPCTEETILQKMAKTGGSGLRLSTGCSMDSNVFVQMSELNALRRQAAEEFKAAVCAAYRREAAPKDL